MKNTGRSLDLANKYTSKYIDEVNAPLYPFGFGLNFTTFTYDAPVLDKQEMTQTDSLAVRVKVANTGKREGVEVVQLYIRDLVGSVTRPVMELKGFQKVSLKPGESREVKFTLTKKDLEFYRKDLSFGTEPGKFLVFAGGNSRDVKQTEFELK